MIEGGYKETFDSRFYRPRRKGKSEGKIYGFPQLKGNWCGELKTKPIKTNLRKAILPRAEKKSGCDGLRGDDNGVSMHDQGLVQEQAQNKHSNTDGFSPNRNAQCGDINVVQYLGIAADEPERIKRHTKPGFRLPLVEIGWDEAYCLEWCKENDLLSPIYTNSARGGCWFCHNQSVNQLRLLRKNYPELWELLLKWDADSPISFKPRGLTVAHFEKRFQLEDWALVPTDRKFRWKMLSLHDELKKK